MPNESLSMDVVLTCLERSGYLLESKIVRTLTNQGYFVEPNQVVRDPRTGKSREIDLIAEYYEYKPEHSGALVKTYFVMEIVNNKFPLVLMTERPHTPNENTENHVNFICTPSKNTFSDQFHLYEHRAPKRSELFSQYCALTQKKSESKEFMASHPDDLYSSFQKLAEYTDGDMIWWDKNSDMHGDRFWRILFWHPLLVVGGQLIVARTREDGSTELRETSSATLEFNWHAGEERRTTLIEVLTADSLTNRLSKIVESDSQMQHKLHAVKVQQGIAIATAKR